jgi:uncharacterized spore protein YtfJ
MLRQEVWLRIVIESKLLNIVNYILSAGTGQEGFQAECRDRPRGGRAGAAAASARVAFMLAAQ